LRLLRDKVQVRKPTEVVSFAKMTDDELDDVLNMENGASKLLTYLESRDLALGLVVGPAHAGAAEAAVRQFAEQSRVDYRVLVRTEEGGSAPTAAGFQAAAAELGLEPQKVMVVSDKSDVLLAGHEATSFSCLFELKNARRPKRTPEFSARTLAEIQYAVEDLNGTSFR
jgi:beta-phosphoglucomutase-like phosphatase (HAD superfamily)